MLISVVIPSRLQYQPQSNNLWLHRAMASVGNQTAWRQHEVEMVVGLDPGVVAPFSLPRVRFVNGTIPLQANVLNAALAVAQGDVIALLEDDDSWDPRWLEVGLGLLEKFDVVTSNQLEISEFGEVIEINDFPTPSGWMFSRSTQLKLGPLDETYRYHLDNEYLGRMTEMGLTRAHVVEQDAELRKWLASIVTRSSIVRTRWSQPLVIRTRNTQGGMSRIAAGGEEKEKSQSEYARLRERYGRIPC